MAILSVFIAIFIVIYIISCSLSNRLTVPVGLFGSFVTFCWIWQQSQNEHAGFFEMTFLISIPLVSSYAWNEKLYHSLLNEHHKLQNIITYCKFQKIGIFLLSLWLFSIGRLCL